MKYCIDCKHCKQNGTSHDGCDWICLYGRPHNLVTGMVDVDLRQKCADMRKKDGKCGIEAIQYIPLHNKK